MRDRHHLTMLASAAALALTLSNNLLAAEGEAAATEAEPAAEAQAEQPLAVSATPAEPATPAPAAEASASADDPAQAARQRAEERRADAMAQRGLRYQELRERAAEAGVELPETPPWEQNELPTMPSSPAMPKGMMTAEERAAHLEAMRNMSPEERMAVREAHWAQMRERAAERGIEMPDTPPWKAAMERRQAMQAQWEAYRKLIDEMSDEQREAAKAVFGRSARAGGPAGFCGQPLPGVAPRGGFGQPAMPRGGYGPCGSMPCQGAPGRGMMPPRQPMMYPQGGQGGARAPMAPMYGNY